VAVTRDRSAPYTAPSAIVELINRYRNRGLPAPIDREVLARASVADGLISRTLQSLEVLDLIDEKGMPTEALEGLRLAPEAEFQSRMVDWLRGAYAEVFSFVDPSQDGETRVRDAFRSYHPVGQQSRMVALFLGLCAAAGLVPEKPESAPRPSARTASPASASPVGTPRQRTIAKRIVSERVLKGAPPPNPAVPPALAGLLASLPAEGDTWTKAERAKFIAAFTAMLDFCFPVEEAAPKTGTAA